MALPETLIPCPDCGTARSPRAIFCPHCGAPGTRSLRVTVRNLDIRFGTLLCLLVKIAFAMLPALIVVAFFLSVIGWLLGGLDLI